MIYLYLSGGLGNQMFEYACALGVSQKYNMPICINTIQVDNDPKRVYGLNNFKLPEDIKCISKNILFHNPMSLFNRLLRKMSMKMSWRFGALFGNYFWKGLSAPYINVNKGKKDIYLDGYWQSEKYFVDIRGLVREQFSIREDKIVSEEYAELKEKILKEEAVCLHVRLGDFVGSSVHSVCNQEYYLKGVEYIKNKLNNPVFFVFSDDVDKARKYFKDNGNYVFISEKITDYESISLMSMCKHFIISNSSFSWWAQYLSDSDNRIVVAPSAWYNNNSDYELKMKDWKIL